jgi:hypothetical protein
LSALAVAVTWTILRNGDDASYATMTKNELGELAKALAVASQKTSSCPPAMTDHFILEASSDARRMGT